MQKILEFDSGIEFVADINEFKDCLMSQDSTSVLGYAYSKDGLHIDYRHPEPIYLPREEFEQNSSLGTRVVKIQD
jgi:predicted GH43/DUF377 family glycosyl hydrolase